MIVVIGYGNELRSDDGVGPRIARAVAEWHIPGVVGVASHGLVPELADVLSRSSRALFVDASPGDRLTVTPVTPRRRGGLGHGSDPGWLLTLAEEAFGRAPSAWLVAVPSVEFAHGESLSPRAEVGMGAALAWIREWVHAARPG